MNSSWIIIFLLFLNISLATGQITPPGPNIIKESEELEDEGESSRSETSDPISSVDYGEDLHKTACEKENMEIVCDEDGVIEILMANYGRLDTQTCPRRRVTTVQDTNCRADSSYEVVANRCNGQSRCRVPVNNGIFQGDPCPGTVKYLEVTYRCDHGQANSSPIKFSTSATINRTTLNTTPRTSATINQTTLNTTPRTPTMQVTSHGIYTSPTVQDIEKAPEKSTTKQTTTYRSGLHCQAVRNRDIDWPMTITGEIMTVKCPDGLNGTAWWSCEGIPARWTPSTGPNLSQCKSPWVTAMYEKLQSIETIDDVIEITDILVSETDSSKKLYGGDVVRCLDIINQLPKMLPELLESLGREERLEFVTDTIQSITASGSNLLAIEHTNAWKDLQNKLTQEATKLLTGMESNGFLLADELPEGSNTQASQNILMEVENFDQEKNSEVKFPRKNSKSTNDDWKMVSDSISLPYESVKARSDNGTAKLVFLIYNHIGQFLNGDSFDDNTTDNATRLVNTRVISASINSMHSPTKLDEPAIIVFQHENANRTNPACSFWNYTLDGEGEWSEYGCETVESNETHTVCACSHLTNFAVLVDVHGTKLPWSHHFALSVITYTGFMISIVCLVICLMTFICFKNIQSDRLTIHKNLCLSLLVAEVLFMAGISQTKRQLMCTIFAVFLHYSFLAVFSWMGLEGIQLYFMLITVFKTGHSRRKYFYLLGYGVPAVIVLTSVIIDHFLYGFRGYGTEWYCWLNTKWGFIWAFVGPICFVILVNIIFLVMTFVVMCRHPTSPTHREDSKMANLRVWLKASCALLCLLGVTWVFGMMYVDSSTMVMAYIFTILNSLQGIFIFIFHCLMDEKIIKEYKRCFQQGRCCPCCDQYSLVNSSNQLATKSTISTKKAGLYNTSTANEKRLSVSSTGKNILDPSVRYTPANQEDQKGTNSTDDINDASSSDKVKFSNLQDKCDINDDDGGGGDTVQHDNTPDQRRSDFEPSTHKNKSDSQLSHPGQQKERRKNDKISTWSMPDLVPKSDTFVVLTSVRKGCSDSNINQPSTLLKKRLEAETSI